MFASVICSVFIVLIRVTEEEEFKVWEAIHQRYAEGVASEAGGAVRVGDDFQVIPGAHKHMLPQMLIQGISSLYT